MNRFSWLAPMTLWPYAEPLLPNPASRPQGGGTPRIQDEATFAAICYVLATGCAWRELPKTFGVSWQTAHRRFTHWANAGLWTALGELSGDETAEAPTRAWAEALSEAAATRLRSAGARPAAAAERPRPRILREFSGHFVEQLFGRRKVVKPDGGAAETEPPGPNSS
ncbi:transposase [Amycolatopsis sp. WGS_07]|uniref:transposase n=1 Tax=Amycolatopsis sp. WGS_07 TaxID=3076764 RepID=UPI0038732C63